ncbi:sterol desaturase family protein [Xinfangfangia sp. D13-10-4-6]|uniref:sterol desaturase family protein n=1 Tax=Pseudogemmobacter hezensis TaxID=2737662 RepID=UPI00155535AA|nr:sterol desaturase family protein [Pseudogemmobacter hezensis]NPD15537.1 sterol desaturase family protein [Pseudogemmobacter hezensis]
MTAVAIPILLMVVLVLAEMIELNRSGRQQVDWHDVVFNLNSGHLMLWLFRGLEIAVYAFVLSHLSLDLAASWPVWLVWLVAIIGWDFCFYWLHRLHHKFRLLWAVHVVHHEGEHFNLSLAIRNSWYSSLASIPFFLPLALIGVPLPVFITVSVIHYGIQMMNHSALTPHLGWLERVLVTPAHHRIHHVADRAYSDSNYAGSFVIWDHLFGTYRPDLPEGEFRYGVKEPTPSRNPAIASNSPFLRLFAPKWLRTRLQARPSTARQAQRSGPDFVSSGPAILLATVGLFCLVTAYIWRYGYDYQGAGLTQALIFTPLAMGAVALGAISDGRAWGLYAWPGACLALMLALVVTDAGPLWLAGAAGLGLHALAMALGWGRKAVPAAPA